MSPKTQSIIKVAGALLVLVLGCNLPAAWSQESPEADTPPPAQPKTADNPEPTQSNGAPSADPIDETSPFDYQASEEISQDRSVSFPVDI